MRGPRIWFDPPLFRWRRVLVTALLAVVGVVGWLVHERGLWPREAEPVLQAASPASAAAARAPLRSTPAAVARLVAAAPVATASPRPGPGEIEVCGLGVVKVGADAKGEQADPHEFALERRSPAARAAWEAALLASPDVRARAAGLHLSGMAGAPDADERLAPLQAARRDALARLALDGRDPVVYAFAMNLCRKAHHDPAGGACQMLSHEQWVTIDPDNASPWLHLADQTSARGADPSEALHHAARATYNRSYWASMHPLVMAAQPSGTPALERVLMSTELMGTQAAWVLPLSGATQACSAAAVRDGNRRQLCEALAELFVERSDTLLDLSAGRGLAERVGWPAERIAALREERDAMLRLQAERLDLKESFSCTGVEAHIAYFAEVGRLGELGAMRESLRRSGKSVAELARRQRESAEAAQRAFRDAAPRDAAAPSSPAPPAPPASAHRSAALAPRLPP